MNRSSSYFKTGIRGLSILFTCIPLLVVSMAQEAEPTTSPLLRELSITVDPNALNQCVGIAAQKC